MISDILDNAETANGVVEDKPKEKVTSRITFVNQTRYLVLILSILALTIVVSNSLALNFTVICMMDEPITITLDSFSGNNTQAVALPQEMFSLTERSVLFSATAIGTLVGSLPVTYLTSRFGFRKIFVAYGLLSAVATLLTPLAVSIGIAVIFMMRVFQGFALATCFVAMGAISSEWATKKATGAYIAWISCHFQLGPMFTMPVAGAMCETWGWEWLYYIQGILSLLIFVLFFYFYRDSPRFQRHVSMKELSLIEEGKLKVKAAKTEKQHIPYKAILTDTLTWSFLGSMGAGVLSIYLIAQFGPVFLNKALKMDIEDTGIMAALPFSLSIVVKLLAGPLSDRLTYINERARVILFASVSQFLMAACYVAMAFLPIEYITLIQVLFTLVVVFSGLNAVGVVKGAHLAAQHFTHVLMAWAGFEASFCTLILPVIVNLMAPDNTTQQWGRIFMLIALIIVITNIFFVITFKPEARPYTIEKKSVAVIENKQTSPSSQKKENV